MFTIATNIPAIYAADTLSRTIDAINKSIQRLATGKRINTASDAPGEILHLSRLKALSVGWQRAQKNTKEAQDLLELASYALSGINGIRALTYRMRDLVLEAANTSTLTTEDLEGIQREIEQLVEEVDLISKSTQYNTKRLLDGSMAGEITSSSPYIFGYVTGKVEDATLEFSSARAATRAVVRAQAPIPEEERMPTSLGDAYDYTKTLGEAVFSPDTTTAASYNADYDIIFTPGNEDHDFVVYEASTGKTVGTGSFGTPFTVSDNNNVSITIYSGTQTIQEGYKGIWHVDTNPSNNTAQEGNLAATGSITIGELSDRALLNGELFIQLDWVNSKLSYRVVDSQGNPQGAWVSVGATFYAWQDSKLKGSHFTLSIPSTRSGYQNIAGKGDMWKITFKEYQGLTSSGTILIEIASISTTVNWDENTTVDDLASSLQSAIGAYTEEGYYSSGTTEILQISSIYPGSYYTPQIRDASGNLAQVMGFHKLSGTGTDALITVNGKLYGPQSSNLFHGIMENGVLVLKEGANNVSGVITVRDKSQRVQAGPKEGQYISFYIPPVDSFILGFKDERGQLLMDVTRPGGAERALEIIDRALDTLSRYESTVGAFAYRLGKASEIAQDQNLALQNAISLIEDTDTAQELVRLTTLEIKRDTASAMLSHANLQPKEVWKLLFGLSEKG